MSYEEKILGHVSEDKISNPEKAAEIAWSSKLVRDAIHLAEQQAELLEEAGLVTKAAEARAHIKKYSDSTDEEDFFKGIQYDIDHMNKFEQQSYGRMVENELVVVKDDKELLISMAQDVEPDGKAKYEEKLQSLKDTEKILIRILDMIKAGFYR